MQKIFRTNNLGSGTVSKLNKKKYILKLRQSILYGAIGGLLMASFLSILSIKGNFGDSGFKFLKYIILLLVFASFYHKHKPQESDRSYMFWHIRKALLMGSTAAIFTILINSMLFAIEPAFSFSKFNLDPAQGSSLLIINLTIFIELFVLACLSAFIIFPIFKPKDDLHIYEEEIV